MSSKTLALLSLAFTGFKMATPATAFDADIRRLEAGALISLLFAFVCFPVGIFFAIKMYLQSREFLTNVQGRDLSAEELVRLATARAVAVIAMAASAVAPAVELVLVYLVNQ